MRSYGTSWAGPRHIIIAYHCDSNTIITVPLKYSANKHGLLAHNAIIKRLKERIMLMYLQILNNEASAEYKRIIKSK